MGKLWKDLDFITATNRVRRAASIVLQIKSPEIFFSCVAQAEHSICRQLVCSEQILLAQQRTSTAATCCSAFLPK